VNEHAADEKWAGFPAAYARTRRFTNGAPRQISVSADGSAVYFLRSGGVDDAADQLWVFDVATGVESLVADPARLPGLGGEAALSDAERAIRERKRLVSGGIGGFAADTTGRLAVFAHQGQLFRADRVAGAIAVVETTGPPFDPRVDPTGRSIAYVTAGALHVTDVDGGGDRMLSPAEDGGTWGMADFIAAEELHRFRGFWWSPDGKALLATRVDESGVSPSYLHDPAEPGRAPTVVAYPRPGEANAEVGLWVLRLDGTSVEARWDRDEFPYLVTVNCAETGALILVADRRQQRALLLRVDLSDGGTATVGELSDTRWVEMIPGSPLQLPDGRVALVRDVTGGERDARSLFVGDQQLSTDDIYVRELVGLLDAADGAAPELVFLGSDDPAEQHVYAVSTAGAGGVRRLSAGRGVHAAAAGGDVLVIASALADGPATTWTVRRGDAPIGELRSLAGTLAYAPSPDFLRVTDRRLPAAVVYPSTHVPGRKLPVLVNIYGGPGNQMVRAHPGAWQDRQWWAESGFAVVTIDNRGTPGVSPEFEKAIFRQIAELVVPDQVDALLAVAERHPDLDLSRVAVRGWSFGGWMAGLLVLSRPDVYRCGIAGAPVTDWALYDTAYTERYLGLPDDPGSVYRRQSLITLAEESVETRPANPLLLVHGMADDNVVAANTLRLSAALLRSGRPHSVLPLPGATHMVNGELAGQLTRFELDFVRRHIGAQGG
jgi:dipeptidyl-peptidase-4